MKKLIALLAIIGLLACVQRVQAQDEEPMDTTEMLAPEDSSAFAADSVMAALEAELGEPDAEAAEEGGGLHKQLKRKFIEGSAAFMSLVALALILGLAFVIRDCCTSRNPWSRLTVS